MDVSQVVESALTLTASDFAQANVEVSVDTHATPLTVHVDPVHLEQVLLNLLRNALDAGGASVEVRTALQTGLVAIEVRDTGPGLPDDVRARLFSPFTTTKPGGLGLGLSLSHSLVEGMHGTLSGENRPEGGATFTVTLPLATRAVEAAGA
ncbi:sensor histidine kinase [Deinococcus yavapaiensis]|uniref:histidine kinase n=1 Tax=Deinococcus yavapaiensis KR-236 TaxID=694435 RepID=A0A318S9H7_9DEIO|nr:ATP-binding protein [Deinococcus yavapaiensis]PYE53113.1 histidine kinase/DNA gyrase B/HSP90-like ATPase [Deinococcus yavapaiensis KR-236]